MTDNIKYTEYTSGLIDRNGVYYPCLNEQHINLEYDLQEAGLLKEGYSSYHKEGWLVLTSSFLTETEFYYDFDYFTVTQKQIEAMRLYKEGKDNKFINFNYRWYHVDQLDDLFINGELNRDCTKLECGKGGNKANQLAFLDIKNIPIPEFNVSKAYIKTEYTLEAMHDLYNVKEGTLVAVRSSSKYSLPGVLKSVLNVPYKSQEYLDAVDVVNTCLRSKESYKMAKRLGVELDDQSIIVQVMIRSDKNENSGAGVVHTRNGNITGRFVAGETGEKLMGNTENGLDCLKLDILTYNKLKKIALEIVNIYSKEQEIEFAWEDGEIYVVQTRTLGEIAYIYEEVSQAHSYLLDGCLVNGGRNGKLSKKSIDEPHILYKNKITVSDMKYANQCRGIISKKGHEFSHAAAICRKLNIPYTIAKGDSWKKVKSLKGEIIHLRDSTIYY